MKNSQKGFVVPLLVVIVVLLVIGGVFYIYERKNKEIVKIETSAMPNIQGLTFPKTDFDVSTRFASIPSETLTEIMNRAPQSFCSELGMRSLLDDVRKAGPTIAEFDANHTIEGFKGLVAFSKITSSCSNHSELIPYLTNIINLAGSSEIEIVTAGSALASFGQPEATKTLVNWSINYSGNADDLIYKWIIKVRDEASIKILFDNIRQQVSFVNKKNKDALIRAVRDWCGFRSENLQPKDCKEASSYFNGL